jgi:hypothetical protein
LHAREQLADRDDISRGKDEEITYTLAFNRFASPTKPATKALLGLS